MTTARDNDPTLLVHAYVDGELDPAHALEVEHQLAADPALAAERDRIETLQRAIRERLPPIPASAGLARRIEAAIATAARPSLFNRLSSPAWSLRGAMAGAPSWRALAASVMLALIVGSSSTWFVLRPGMLNPADETADMVVASHIRALMAPQPADVATSDRHTVKPWFNGRVIEAPRVVDLGSEGFPLVGGRVDVIGRTPVATLVYRRRQHLISLFAVPKEQAQAAGQVAMSGRRDIAGYNILTWRQNGTVYWAVSDVAAPDLDVFAKAFREASG
jgi:anti-sigma factor RsiW